MCPLASNVIKCHPNIFSRINNRTTTLIGFVTFKSFVNSIMIDMYCWAKVLHMDIWKVIWVHSFKFIVHNRTHYPLIKQIHTVKLKEGLDDKRINIWCSLQILSLLSFCFSGYNFKRRPLFRLLWSYLYLEIRLLNRLLIKCPLISSFEQVLVEQGIDTFHICAITL